MKKTILIGGGSGLIGTRLAQLLSDRGDDVRLLSRSPREIEDYPSYDWDAKAGTLAPDALDGVTHVVNLAGAGIADGRWTSRRKRAVIESRTQTTALLARAIRERGSGVEAFVSAGAIGYYGNRGERLLTEGDRPGEGFLSESTILWERAVGELAGQTGVRTVVLRTGIVLADHGGALEKMLLTARLGLSGYFGDGSQWYSWIHLDDICRMYVAAVDDDRFAGPVNAVAPEPARNKHLAQVLAEALPNPAVAVPVPALALRLALGEMSHTVLDSTRVSDELVRETLGFTHDFPTLRSALEHLVGASESAPAA